MRKHKSRSNNPEEFVTIQFDLEPELVVLVQAFAAEANMSPESFAGMVVGQYQAP